MPRLNITFPAGVKCAPFDIPIINDDKSENDETFSVEILRNSLPFGVNLGEQDKADVTIIDNDCKFKIIVIITI